MESQPQNPEFRNNPENFHPCESTKWVKVPTTCEQVHEILILIECVLSFCKFRNFS